MLAPAAPLESEPAKAAVFAPHVSACFLAVDNLERIVFSDALVGGWRPAAQSFMTAIIILKDHLKVPTTWPT